MTTWLDCISDPRPVQAIYGTTPPSLRNVTLHEVCLHREGPRVMMRFDLADFPDQPPKKWRDHGYDVAQVVVMLIGVWEISLQNWTSNPVVNLAIARENGGIRIHSYESPIHININSETAQISSISAYKDAP